ncbi:MAG: universal stress protein [Alphaproteobacteria bacterium]|nr:universal stress protein [Alphaproteobacteria bacterium]
MAAPFYQRILLATDETRESLTALREGALLAMQCRAEVFLLLVATRGAGASMADGIHAVERPTRDPELLTAGLTRLRALGLKARGQAVAGEPALVIGAAAKRFKADLVVVGHRRQHLLERWWSGASGAYIIDQVDCSVLVARGGISDAEFERLVAQGAP